MTYAYLVEHYEMSHTQTVIMVPHARLGTSRYQKGVTHCNDMPQ